MHLIAELRRYVPEKEQSELDQVLAHLSGIYIHLDVEKVALVGLNPFKRNIFWFFDQQAEERQVLFFFSPFPFPRTRNPVGRGAPGGRRACNENFFVTGLSPPASGSNVGLLI